nr:reverse transcriptase domain-containing protein [Tanacetum cinerariifolium]
MRVANVPSSSIKLMLFPFSLEGAARIWLEKKPPRSIQTWDDLVSKFINQFFPPSKTTNLRNEITRFQQRFDESFYEAWERFNDLLRACPHHEFSELHQLDTFYNALNVNDQDSLNSAAGTSSSTPAISSDVAELKDMVKALLLDKKNQSPAPTLSTTLAPVKAVESNRVTCGGAHSYQNCPTTQENAYRDNIQEYVSQAAAANYNQGNTDFRPQMVANQIRPPGFPPHQNNQNNFNRGNNFNQNREVELKDLPHHLEYTFLEGNNKLPVIIAKELGSEEKAALIKVLKSHKRAIDWKLSDIQGINPELCTHKILMEEYYKPAVQHQRRVNPKIHDVIKKEVEKLLDAGLIYPISDSP